MLHDACEFVNACCMRHVNLGVLVHLKGLSDVMVVATYLLVCYGELAPRA